MYRAVRVASFVVATASLVWALRLILFGGIRVVVAGQLIRSSDYWRPIEIASAAVLVFFAAGGRRSVVDAYRRSWRFVERPNPGAARWITLALVATAFVVTFTYQATTCGGTDSSGYMSEAQRWLRGTTVTDLRTADIAPWPNAAWTFTPLGYTPTLDGPPFRMSPSYAPGLPWLLAGATVVGGDAGMSVVEPLCFAALVLAAFGIGRRLGGPWTGLTAAWLASTSPILLATSMTTMSDVPAGAAWGAAFYFLIGAGPWSAVAAGLSASLAITIRPNLAFLAAIMIVWFAIRPGAGGSRSWRTRVRDAAAFVVGVAPGVAAIAIVNARWYGSPFESGYGSVSRFFSLAHVWPNLIGYSRNAMDSESLLVIGSIAGLAIPAIWATGLPRRAMAVGAILVMAATAEYLAYDVYGDWAFLRFFLVVWALVVVAAAGPITRLARGRSTAVRAAVVALLVGYGAWSLQSARAHNGFGEPWDRHYAAAARFTADVVPPGAAVFCFIHSGSIAYYSGHEPIRWDVFDGAWLDRAVAWLSARGVQSYAVLERWEVQDFREHFAGQRAVDALDVPVGVYYAYGRRTSVFVFNLSSPPALGTRPIVFNDDDPSRWRNLPPGPEATLTLQSSSARASRLTPASKEP